MTKNFELWKYCPHCGGSEFTQRENGWKCSSCEQSFYENVAACVAIIFYIENSESSLDGIKIVISKRGIEPDKGTYDFPGGFMSPGETAKEAISREVKEELDFTLNQNDLCCLTTQPALYVNANIDTRVLDIVFIYKITQQEFNEMRVADDVEAVELISVNDLSLYNTSCSNIQTFVDLAKTLLLTT